MYFLEQSTATTFKAGPFLDDTDGKTAETALTISQADIRLSKNGGDFAQTADVSGAVHDEFGWYDVPIHATDVNNTGRLKVSIQKSGALPVWHDFMVLSSLVYDSMIVGDDNLQVDILQVGNSSASQIRFKDLIDTGYNSTTHKVQGVVLTDTTTTNSDMRGTNDASTASSLSTHDGKLDTVDSNVVAIKAKTDNLPVPIKKNTALSAFPFFMVDSTSRPDGKTGLTVTSQRSINGGIFSNCTNPAVEVSNGWYKIDLSAADLNGDTIALKFTASGSDGRQITIITDT